MGIHLIDQFTQMTPIEIERQLSKADGGGNTYRDFDTQVIGNSSRIIV